MEYSLVRGRGWGFCSLTWPPSPGPSVHDRGRGHGDHAMLAVRLMRTFQRILGSQQLQNRIWKRGRKKEGGLFPPDDFNEDGPRGTGE